MRIIKSPNEMKRLAESWRRKGMSVGFVPTMGAFHEGHLSLMRRARRENDVLAVSVFVNPTQFGPREDFARYPAPWSRDKKLALKERVDVLFRPEAGQMYPSGYDTWVTVDRVSRHLCGARRPGHFRGVATVVLKLFNTVLPTRAYFGMKDFQQLRVIQRMAKDLHLSVRIVPCPTVRESNGLARSSRNVFLSPDERRRAGEIRRALQCAAEVIKSKPAVSSSKILRLMRRLLDRVPGLRIDYLGVVDPDYLQPLRIVRGRALLAAAVYAGQTRLIDNLPVGTSGA